MLDGVKRRPWTARLRDRVRRWLQGRAAKPSSVFPDYVPCPHCGEPEVEVWSDQPGATCHQCGRLFDYPPSERR